MNKSILLNVLAVCHSQNTIIESVSDLHVYDLSLNVVRCANRHMQLWTNGVILADRCRIVKIIFCTQAKKNTGSGRQKWGAMSFTLILIICLSFAIRNPSVPHFSKKKKWKQKFQVINFLIKFASLHFLLSSCRCVKKCCTF